MALNPTVKSILFNARLLYLVKYQAVKNLATTHQSALEADHKKYHTLFAHWANPKFWKEEIPWIPGKTSQLILDLDQVDPAQTNAFLSASTKLRDHLESVLLKDTLKRISQTDTSTWNLRMLNALRKTLQQEQGRVAFFKTKGTDLDQDGDFQKMKNHQLEVVRTYRELLTTNAVEANQSKVENIKKRGDGIEKETVLSEFLRLYKKVTAFLAKQIDSVSLLPHLAETPGEENQKSLQALSLALITLDQKIATLAAAGQDFTKEATFTSLSTDQWTLQNSFSKALQDNSIEVTNTCTTDLNKITTDIQQANDLAGIQLQFESLNGLMRTQISATT